MVMPKIIMRMASVGIVSAGALLCLTSAEATALLKRKKKSCRMETAGTILRAEMSVVSGERQNADMVFYLVYEYEAGGRKIVRKSRVGRSRHIFKDGDTVTVYYDPDEEESHYIAELEAGSMRSAFGLAGIALILAGLIGLTIVRRI